MPGAVLGAAAAVTAAETQVGCLRPSSHANIHHVPDSRQPGRRILMPKKVRPLSISRVPRGPLARGRGRPVGELLPPGPGPVRPTRETIIILVVVIVSVVTLLALHVPVGTALAVVTASGVISAEIAVRLAMGRQPGSD